MANSSLARFEPFGSMMRADPFRSFEDLFNELNLAPRLISAGMAPRVRMDVTETDQAYTVKAEVPGVKKEDIKVNIDGNQVSITAEVQKESEQKDETRICSERSWGQYYRSFTLPQAVDDAQAKAEYHDGILELSLPKKGGGSAKTLAIQ